MTHHQSVDAVARTPTRQHGLSTRVKRLFFVAFILACGAVGLAQTGDPPESPKPLARGPAAQSQQASLQQVLAQKMRELGKCQADLGPLTALQASLVDGTLFDAASAKARIEAANPDLVLDLQTWRVTAKPKPRAITTPEER